MGEDRFQHQIAKGGQNPEPPGPRPAPPCGSGGCGTCRPADTPTGDTELVRCRAQLEAAEWALAMACLRELLWLGLVCVTAWLLCGWWGG